MTSKLLWRSPSIPEHLIESDSLAWEIRAKVEALSAEDEPSSNDIVSMIHRYNSSTAVERDAIDAAFVWMTGYTFATICAMVVTPKGKDYEKTLEKWRRGGS